MIRWYGMIELIVTLVIGSQIGFFWSFFEFVLSAFVGLILLANFRTSMLEAMVLWRGDEHVRYERINDNVLRLIGAILLLLPGFVGDLMGIVLQFPSIFRPLQRKYFTSFSKDTTHDDVMDAEIINDTPALR